MEDIIRCFKDKFEHMVINFQRTDNKFYQDILNELKIINKSIEEQNIRDSFTDILFETEMAILLEHKMRCQIISEQFEKVKGIIMNAFGETLNNLQNKLQHSNICKFNIICKSEYDLILAGSFDFAYYHDLEIIFKDVDFIFCPGCMFNIDNFRLATNDEIMELNKFMDGWEKEGFVTCLESSFSGCKYYIVAKQVQFKFEQVIYDVTEDLMSIQRISDWAKVEIASK